MRSIQRIAGAAALAMLACPGITFGQPLVTGDLTIYLDFDEIVPVLDLDGNTVDGFADESGNGFDGYIGKAGPDDLEPGSLTLETTSPFRGAASAKFTQSPDNLDFPIFVAFDGPAISATDKLPDSAFTIAAWVNVEENGQDQSVFQSRSGGGAFNHVQLQSNGRLRFRLRGDLNSENITVPDQYYTDGSSDNVDAVYPFDTWIHYAGTYDQASDTWALYFNGVPIAGGQADPGVGPIPMGDWLGQIEAGNWFTAGIGAVPDSGGRRLSGLYDELYIFHRALSASEIATLASTSVATAGDFNSDGKVDDADFALFESGFGTSMDGQDFLDWQANYGFGVAAATAVPEPASLIGLLGMGLAVASRRRR